MDTWFTIGQILFGALIAFSGLGHFKNYKKSVEYSKMNKVPLPGLAVAGSGLLLLVGGLAFLFNVMMYEGALLLVIFFVPVTLWMHRFWKHSDPQKKMSEMHYFMGNMMIVGLLLMMMSYLG